jgi:hypothetical protein
VVESVNPKNIKTPIVVARLEQRRYAQKAATLHAVKLTMPINQVVNHTKCEAHLKMIDANGLGCEENTTNTYLNSGTICAAKQTTLVSIVDFARREEEHKVIRFNSHDPFTTSLIRPGSQYWESDKHLRANRVNP